MNTINKNHSEYMKLYKEPYYKSGLIIFFLILLLIINYTENDIKEKFKKKEINAKYVNMTSWFVKFGRDISITVIIILLYTTILNPIDFILSSIQANPLSVIKFRNDKYQHIIYIIENYLLDLSDIQIGQLKKHIYDTGIGSSSAEKSSEEYFKNTISQINELSYIINNDWIKINNKYWIPRNDGFTDSYDENLQELENKMTYADLGIKKSTMTQTIFIIDELNKSKGLVNFFLTDNLIKTINNNSYKSLFEMLISYIYEKQQYGDTIKYQFKDLIKKLSMSPKIDIKLREFLSLFNKFNFIEKDNSIIKTDITDNFYTFIFKNVMFFKYNNINLLDIKFLEKFNGNEKFNCKIFLNLYYETLTKIYPYLEEKRILLTKTEYNNILNEPDKIGLNSIVDINILKEYYYKHIRKELEGMLDKNLISKGGSDVNDYIINENRKPFNIIHNENLELLNEKNDSKLNELYLNFTDTIDNNLFVQMMYFKHTDIIKDFSFFEYIEEQIKFINDLVGALDSYDNLFELDGFNKGTILDSPDTYDYSTLLLKINSLSEQILKNKDKNKTDEYKVLDKGSFWYDNLKEKIETRIGDYTYLKDYLKLKMIQLIYKKKYKLLNQNEEKFKKLYKKVEEIPEKTKGEGDQVKQEGDEVKQEGDEVKQVGDEVKQVGDEVKLKKLKRNNNVAEPPKSMGGGSDIKEKDTNDINTNDTNDIKEKDINDTNDIKEEDTDDIFINIDDLKTDTNNIVLQLENIEKVRNDIFNGISNSSVIGVQKFNEISESIFKQQGYPLVILNINTGIICSIIICLYYLLMNQLDKKHIDLNKLQILVLYIIGIYFILEDKIINRMLHNTSIKELLCVLVVIRTVIQISLIISSYGSVIIPETNIIISSLPKSLTEYLNNSKNSNEESKLNTEKNFWRIIKWCGCFIDLITIFFIVLITLNYMKILTFEKTKNKTEILDIDENYNCIRNITLLEYSKSTELKYFPAFLNLNNTFPEEQELLILYDNINSNNQGKWDIFWNCVYKAASLIIILNIINTLCCSEESYKGSIKEVYDTIVLYLLIAYLLFGPNFTDLVRKGTFYGIKYWHKISFETILNGIRELNPRSYKTAIGSLLIIILIIWLIYSFISIDNPGAFNFFKFIDEGSIINLTAFTKNNIMNLTSATFDRDALKYLLLLITIHFLAIFGKTLHIKYYSKNISYIIENTNTYKIINTFEKKIVNKSSEIKGGKNSSKIFILGLFLILIILFLNSKKSNNKRINIKKENSSRIYDLEKQNKELRGGSNIMTSLLFDDILKLKPNYDSKTLYRIETSIICALIGIVLLIIVFGFNNRVTRILIENIMNDNNNFILGQIIIYPYIFYMIMIVLYGISQRNIFAYLDIFFEVDIEKNKKIESEVRQYNFYFYILMLLITIIGILRSNIPSIFKTIILIAITYTGLFIFYAILKTIYSFIRIIDKKDENVIEEEKIDESRVKYKEHKFDKNNIVYEIDNAKKNEKDKKIIDSIKKDIILKIELLRNNFNIRENIIINIDEILSNWTYYKDDNNNYINIIEEMKNLDKLNKSVNLDTKELIIQRVLNKINNYETKFDGVWERKSNNDKNNNVERLVVKTHGHNALIITLNNTGYILEKYNMNISSIRNDSENIEIYDTNGSDFILKSKDINNEKYFIYNKFNTTYQKLIDLGSDIKDVKKYLKNGKDFFKKINYILDPVKNVEHIVKYKLLEDAIELEKIENDINKKCLKSLLIERIYTKILLINSIKEENYKISKQINNTLESINKRYNDLKELSLNRNAISLVTYKNINGIYKIDINMSNLIGNVLIFSNKNKYNIVEHTHLHDVKGHKHSPPENTTIPMTQIPEKPHIHKHKHINYGEEISDIKEECSSNVKLIPENINKFIEKNENITLYRYNEKRKEHQLIFKNTMKSDKLKELTDNLNIENYTDFYTGIIDFTLEYINDKNKKIKINNSLKILGKDCIYKLPNELNPKNKTYLKDIIIYGYEFDTNADKPCTVNKFSKNKINSLIVDNYDMSSEFCI